jgi:trehalose 6-phosphate synthase
MADENYSFVVVSNRLPIDHVVDEDGRSGWRASPGGLVTALEPVMRAADGAWVGWAGQPDLELDPFDNDGIRIVPVPLSAYDLEMYYEGFSNDTLWPLYHDVIAQPGYHRVWWDSYYQVNRRFADAVVAIAAHGATVWVQDYQLQLVPRMLREARPDLTIGFFLHIPFPAYGIYSQLPWRTRIIEGLLGADVVGFQRVADAGNFSRAVRRLLGYSTKSPFIDVPATDTTPARRVMARPFPISIDVASFERLANQPEVRARAEQIRADLGNPKTIMLGVDRLDYTKGIERRLKAFRELLADGKLSVPEAVMVQVATPSRERVEHYQALRVKVEREVGRINGEFGRVGVPAVHYLHQSYSRSELAALYCAADVMMVTPLRDGMNLVAKEYVASRADTGGALVLSEFAGAATELRQAFLCNPHDPDGVKDALLRAVHVDDVEARRRMRIMQRHLRAHDVGQWAHSFLHELGVPEA